jgi:hypothetical protein
MTTTKTAAVQAYETACALYDAAFDVWHPIPRLYREGRIGDAEFIAARREFDAAKDVWEAARAALS